MRKNIIRMLISVMMFFSFESYAKSAEDVPGGAIFVMAHQNQILINEKSINDESEHAKIHITIPELQGLTDKKFQNTINHYFYKEACTLKNDLLKHAKKDSKNKEKGRTFIPYELIYHYNQKEAPKNYLILGIFEYIYTGGAHGLTSQNYLVIDKTQNKILMLEDLFEEDENYKDKINAEIKRQIEERKQEGTYFFEGVGSFEGISDEQVFYLNAQGDLVIVFNIYEIAPYATGILEFTLPMKGLLGGND